MIYTVWIKGRKRKNRPEEWSRFAWIEITLFQPNRDMKWSWIWMDSRTSSPDPAWLHVGKPAASLSNLFSRIHYHHGNGVVIWFTSVVWQQNLWVLCCDGIITGIALWSSWSWANTALRSCTNKCKSACKFKNTTLVSNISQATFYFLYFSTDIY